LKDNNSPIIEVKNLGTSFEGFWVHKNLNLTIYPNRIITIIGASGCGKTTLVREILMLQPIAEGEILLNGEEISKYNIEDADTKLVLSQIGMMFQQGALFSSLTVLQNVMFPLVEYTNFSEATIKEIATLKLKLTGLPESAYSKFPKEISPGMQKRVALARTLVLDPKVVFLDEPTAGLDPNSASDFDELISNLQKQLGLTVIMITHDLDSIWSISDEIVYLGEKKVLFHDTVIKAANCKEIPQLYDYFNGPRGRLRKQAHLEQKDGGVQ
jgi:phospholipid/cholesterol/gamma-HCH transport system ATP-binding protein